MEPDLTFTYRWDNEHGRGAASIADGEGLVLVGEDWRDPTRLTPEAMDELALQWLQHRGVLTPSYSVFTRSWSPDTATWWEYPHPEERTSLRHWTNDEDAIEAFHRYGRPGFKVQERLVRRLVGPVSAPLAFDRPTDVPPEALEQP